MIRKAIIILLTVAAIGAGTAWAASYYGISLGRTVFTSPNRQPLPAQSVHSLSVTLVQGHFYLQRSKLPAVTLPDQLEQKFLGLFTDGCHLGVGEQIPAELMGALYGASPWLPKISRLGMGTVTFHTPLWIVTLLLAAYPASVLIRDPLHRWRRRRSGLCLKCGYNLTGNVTGKCSECGSKIEGEQ